LLVRGCGSAVPSDQEVRDYYGVPDSDPVCPCGGAWPYCKECPPTPTPNGNGNGEPTPTEERPVKWIPEPFFSFINEVFRR